MLRALRSVFGAQSVTPEVVSSIMDKVTPPLIRMRLLHFPEPSPSMFSDSCLEQGQGPKVFLHVALQLINCTGGQQQRWTAGPEGDHHSPEQVAGAGCLSGLRGPPAPLRQCPRHCPRLLYCHEAGPSQVCLMSSNELNPIKSGDISGDPYSNPVEGRAKCVRCGVTLL